MITASAVPKAPINFFSTKAGAGPIAQKVSLRQQRGRVKPVIAPVSPVMRSNPSVCPVLTATTWRVACVDSTVRWECILQMMVPADDVLPTVTYAQMTGPASGAVSST